MNEKNYQSTTQKHSRWRNEAKDREQERELEKEGIKTEARTKDEHILHKIEKLKAKNQIVDNQSSISKRTTIKLPN